MIAPTRLVIAGPTVGFETFDKPWLLNNDAFPILNNGLCWRKQLIKKPGSHNLGRLQRTITSTGSNPVMTLDGSGNGSANLITLFSLEAGSSIAPGSIILTDGTNNFTEPAIPDGTLVGTPGGTGTINYATGAITISGGAAGQKVTGTFGYYPDIPVMGIRLFESDKDPTTPIDFPVNVFFDQTYSYQYNGTVFFDVSFYKGTGTPVTWHGANYQQFFTSNYFRAMFATNNNPGMQFESISAVAVGATTTITTAAPHGLITGDYVFFNELTGADAGLLNGQSAQITKTGAMTFTVPINTAGKTINNVGIFQTLTATPPGSTVDGIRWYDGFGASLGWVNFAPPLDNLQSSATTYLMGCRMILPFGNRLLAIGTFEATSAQAATPTYYGNRIRYCEVTATPFYSLPVPSTLPSNPPAVEPNAWASNIQGFGGSVDLDTTERIISSAITQGNLIQGMESHQRRLSLTGIETDPFTSTVINPDFGTAGTQSIIPMDKGVLTAGEYGFITASSYDAKRFDEKIIDQIFQINANSNGFERICAQRDFFHEVVYFTFVENDQDATALFPARTVVYNYREGSFALWIETFTTYGIYKISTGQTWQDYKIPWENWNEKWEDLGGSQYEEPYVAGGTPQGYVHIKWTGNSTNDPSMFIQAITVGANDIATITSPNHNLQQGMFVGLWNIGDELPEFIGQIDSVTDANTIVVAFKQDPSVIVPGIWQMSVVDQPNIYTKQFPAAWSDSKKTRIGAQKYFMDTTDLGEFTVNIYGSQSTLSLDDPTNNPSVISSNTVRTRPDDSLGINDGQQYQTQIWHRLASSAIGDTIQLQFTFSVGQMYDVGIATSPWVFQACVLDLYPSRMLA